MSFPPAKADKRPKGNGIKDGSVRQVLCLCRSLLVLFVGFVRLPAVAILAYKNIQAKAIRNSCSWSGYTYQHFICL